MLVLAQALLGDLQRLVQLQSLPVPWLPRLGMLRRQMCALHPPKRTYSYALTGYLEADGLLLRIRNRPWTRLDGGYRV